MVASCVLCCHVLSCGTLNLPVLVIVSHATVFVIVIVHYLHQVLSKGRVNVVFLPQWVVCSLHLSLYENLDIIWSRTYMSVVKRRHENALENPLLQQHFSSNYDMI